MDRIKYLKWIAEESPTDDEMTTTIVSLVGAQKGPRRFSCL